VGHLLDLLGVDRFWPELFDEFVRDMGRTSETPAFGGETGRANRLAALARRMSGRRR